MSRFNNGPSRDVSVELDNHHHHLKTATDAPKQAKKSNSTCDIASDIDDNSDQFSYNSESSESITDMKNECPSDYEKYRAELVAKIPNPLDRCKYVWRHADAVCFDVDSTVCCDEAIDELAKYVGKSKEVSDITRSAMLGGANFRQALAKRLDIIRPNTKILSDYISTHPPRLTDHIEDLIAKLHQLGRDVYLISGGFDVIIHATADKLNIPRENVYANCIKFYYDGTYAGFEKSKPTSNQDGKSRVISMLKRTKGYKNVVMVGDGVTDLEACPPADAFIGFGGNQVRQTVRDNSDWFVCSFKDLITELHCNNDNSTVHST